MAAAEKRKSYEARITDEIHPGEQQPETDHNLKSENSSSGDAHGRKWRDANGWFSYEMRVVGDRPMQLVCTYWGGERGRRAFDILVDDQIITSENIGNGARNDFIDKTCPIPAALTSGKEKVTVMFRARPDNRAGGVFGLAMIRARE